MSVHGYLSPSDNGCKHFEDCFTCPYPDCIAGERNPEVSKKYYETHKSLAEWEERRKQKIREWQMNNPEKVKEYKRIANARARQKRKELKESKKEQNNLSCFDCKHHFMSDCYLECYKHNRINDNKICDDFEKEQKNE